MKLRNLQIPSPLLLVRRANWQWIASLACVAAALSAAGAGIWLDRQTSELHAATARMKIRARKPIQPNAGVNATATRLRALAPPAERYFDDIRTFFNLATRQGLQVSATEYQPDDSGYPGFVLRTMHVRTRDEYPALKEFLAGLLEAMPHAFLTELRFDRSEQGSSAVDAALTLSLVYRPVAGAPGAPAPAASTARGAK